MSFAERKKILRCQALEARKKMSVLQRIEGGLALSEHADDLRLPQTGVIAGFWPIRDEIDPRPLMDVLRRSGYQLCLPAVVDDALVFRLFTADTAFEPAGFGTMAPGANAPAVLPDVLLMPLAAFDCTGNRIGYGGGYYDRALAKIERTKKRYCIGLAFDEQEVQTVPCEAHDRRLDGILTPSGVRLFDTKENL